MKKKLYIMNSAMMPNDGFYSKKTVSATQAAELFDDLARQREVVGTLGYPNICAIASALLQYPFVVNRKEITFKKGDVAICFQLVYRVIAPGEKSLGIHGNSIDDYKVSVVEFYGTRI